MYNKNGSLRLCVKYRALIHLIIPNKYLLPTISQLLNNTRSGKWFTRLDVKNGYNLMRITVGDEWKTAFHTKQVLFDYTVMPFALINTPALLYEIIDTIIKHIKECMWYLDDILIYGGNTEGE